MKNIFQKIIDKEELATFLYEDKDFIIIDNKYPKTPIHYLIIPKKQISSITEATTDDINTLGNLLLLASTFAKDQKIIDYKLVFNCGKHQDIPHLHLHFLAGNIE